MNKIPEYIKKHIEQNNKLLQQAEKHTNIVMEWYDKQCEKLNYYTDEEIEDMGYIDIEQIKRNLNIK